jgi:RNA-directed DNA polymerase
MIDFAMLVGAQMKVQVDLVQSALDFAHIRYRKIRVKKRSGGERVLVQPAAELKMVLAWLEAGVISKLPISSVATAFRPGASIVKNANEHRNSLYSVRVDIKDFFSSIRASDLMAVVRKNLGVLPLFVTDPGFDELVRRGCFDRDGRLPIGYPTSPGIANAVMYGLDGALLEMVKRDPTKFGLARLTRYADDFVFSTDKPGACRMFVHDFEQLLAKNISPRLRINASKTRFMSRAGGSTLVTGLRINQNGLIRVHPAYRDHVRLLMKHFSAGVLVADDLPRLVGHLAFVEHADPRLFTRLSFRYFEEIARLRGK